MADFEEAIHQGFSRADVAQEIKEMDERMNHLGCRECFHLPEGSSVCDMIIRRDDAFKDCPYFFKKEENK